MAQAKIPLALRSSVGRSIRRKRGLYMISSVNSSLVLASRRTAQASRLQELDFFKSSASHDDDRYHARETDTAEFEARRRKDEQRFFQSDDCINSWTLW